MDSCIFCRIVRGEIPSRKLFEDEELLAFHDIQPKAPVHFLVIPKLHVPSLYECDATHEGMLGRLLARVPQLARAAGLADGFRVIVNTGRVGNQEVAHLHAHVLGGPNPLGAMVPRSQH